jgi:hypothetical protein
MKQTLQASEQRNSAGDFSSRRLSVVRWPHFFRGLALVAGLFLTAATVLPQRPVLRYARRDYLAGSLVLLPAKAQLHAFGLPKQLASLADHELRTPPLSALGDPAQLRRWAEEYDYALTDGVMLSLDALLGPSLPDTPRTAPNRLNFLKTLRERRPQLPLYAFVSAAGAGAGLDLVAAGQLDFLLIKAEPAALPTLNAQISQRRLQERVAFHQAAESATLLLQTRLLNRRFGYVPQVLPIFASSPAPAQQQRLQQLVRTQLTALDAAEVPANAGPSARPDLLLFVVTPDTAPPALSNFVNTLEKAVEEGFRCAVLDLSREQPSQEALLNQLRQRKLLDRLGSYAALNMADSSPDAAAAEASLEAAGQALSRVLAQANHWLISIKFLRDDVERLRRTERAQIGLLLSSYLRDWAYQWHIRPRLADFLRAELKQTPDQLTDPEPVAEPAETFALEELRPYAEKLFAEQFKRNIHAVLLEAEERAEFEVTLLQRVQLRLTPDSLTEPEIRVYIHLVHLGNFLPPPALPRATWDLTNGRGLDERLSRRFESVHWNRFKTDAEAVEVSIRLNSNSQANPESYALRSRRGGQTRRIEINAATAQGAFYAFARLEQLGADGQLAQDINLTEAPSLAQRGLVERFAESAWSQRERLETLRFLGRVRLNRYVYASLFDPRRREQWREPYPNRELVRFRKLTQTAQENFVTVAYALSPGATLRYASDEDFAALTAKLKALASVGLTEFVLAFDDAPEQLQDAGDRTRFLTLAAAQNFFLRRVAEWLKVECPGCRLTVVPANLLNPVARTAYLQELGPQLPASVSLICLSSEGFLPEYTLAQAQELSKLTGRQPLVWSSVQAYEQAGKRLFLGAKRNEAPGLPQSAAGFLLIPAGPVYALRLPLTTAADYAWDARGYDPARAWESALKVLFDERSRAGVRLWARAYGGAALGHSAPEQRVKGQHANAQPPHLFDPLFNADQAVPNAAQLEEQLNILQSALTALGATRERGLLRGELAPFLRRAQLALRNRQ